MVNVAGFAGICHPAGADVVSGAQFAGLWFQGGDGAVKRYEFAGVCLPSVCRLVKGADFAGICVVLAVSSHADIHSCFLLPAEMFNHIHLLRQ